MLHGYTGRHVHRQEGNKKQVCLVCLPPGTGSSPGVATWYAECQVLEGSLFLLQHSHELVRASPPVLLLPKVSRPLLHVPFPSTSMSRNQTTQRRGVVGGVKLKVGHVNMFYFKCRHVENVTACHCQIEPVINIHKAYSTAQLPLMFTEIHHAKVWRKCHGMLLTYAVTQRRMRALPARTPCARLAMRAYAANQNLAAGR